MMNVSCLWESLWGRLPSPLVVVILTPVAILCGTLLGEERQRREKSAGLRTLAMVCLGAAVFTMMSFAFTSTTGDSGRVAAQIVTGIGFLGAGVIMHGRRFATGVTTAAIIWVAAGIGMVVGGGFPIAGLVLSVVVNRWLKLVDLFQTRWHPDVHDAFFTVEYNPNNGITRVRLENILIDYESVGVTADWTEESRATGRVGLTMRLPRAHMYELLAEIADVTDVTSVVRERCERSSAA